MKEHRNFGTDAKSECDEASIEFTTTELSNRPFSVLAREVFDKAIGKDDEEIYDGYMRRISAYPRDRTLSTSQKATTPPASRPKSLSS